MQQLWQAGKFGRLARACRGKWSAACAGALNLAFPPQCAFCAIDLPPDAANQSSAATGLRDSNGSIAANAAASTSAATIAVANSTTAPVLLCRDCRRQFARPAAAACARCGSALGPNAPIEQRCVHCQRVEFSFSRVFAVGPYRDELREAVLRMKRPGSEPLAVALARLLAETHRLGLQEFDPELVIAVPMHWSHRFLRGVNSPETLAAFIAPRLRARVITGALVRHRATRPQNDFPHEDRPENIRGAFRARRLRRLRGRRILLVDDVLTTGATADEAAKILLLAGAKQVAVAVVARTEGAANHAAVATSRSSKAQGSPKTRPVEARVVETAAPADRADPASPNAPQPMDATASDPPPAACQPDENRKNDAT